MILMWLYCLMFLITATIAVVVVSNNLEDNCYVQQLCYLEIISVTATFDQILENAGGRESKFRCSFFLLLSYSFA